MSHLKATHETRAYFSDFEWVMTGLESRTGIEEHSWLNKAKLALMGADKLCEGLESNDHQFLWWNSGRHLEWDD